MSSSKKMTCKGTLRQVFICLRPRTPYPPPPVTHNTCIQHTSTSLHREGWGGGTVEPEIRATVYKAGSKIPT
jgi:hypothetical protein